MDNLETERSPLREVVQADLHFPLSEFPGTHLRRVYSVRLSNCSQLTLTSSPSDSPSKITRQLKSNDVPKSEPLRLKYEPTQELHGPGS